MRPLFFAPTETITAQGAPLSAKQTEILSSLLFGISRTQPDELAERICRQVLREARWNQAVGWLELQEEGGFRLHLNLPLSACLAQMELYTWQDENDDMHLGVGTTDCTDYALIRLDNQELKALGHTLLEGFRY